MQLLILANAIFHATFVFYHDESDQIRKIWYYYVEVGFTILFNTEVIIKIYAFGWKAYIARGQHKFDCILCVGKFTFLKIIIGTRLTHTTESCLNVPLSLCI